MGIIETTKLILTKPMQFFDQALNNGEGYGSVIKYYSIVSIVGLVLQVVLGIIFGVFSSMLSPLLDSSMSFSDGVLSSATYSVFMVILYVLYIPVGLIFGILGTFISSGITHVCAKIFGATGEFIETYKVMVYAQTPTILFSFIGVVPILNLLAFGLYGWTTILSISGISKAHNLSIGKAVGVIVLPSFLFLCFVSMLVMALVMLFVVSIPSGS